MFDIIKGIPEDKTGLGLATYCLCSDGIYLVKACGCGYITVKINGIVGLPVGESDIAVLPRKIPALLFWEIQKFFRYVELDNANKQLEAYILIMYNTETDKYFLHVPIQAIGAGSAKYDLSNLWTDFPNCKLIMDVHSHTSNMNAFWSSTDNADDNRDRYSGVMGRINKVIPQFKARFSTMGTHVDADFDDLFCESTESFSLDFEKSMQNISIQTPKPATDNAGPRINNRSSYSQYGIPSARSGYAGLWNSVRDRI